VKGSTSYLACTWTWSYWPATYRILWTIKNWYGMEHVGKHSRL